MKKLDAISLSQLTTEEFQKTCPRLKILTDSLAGKHDFIHRTVADIEKSLPLHAEINDKDDKKSDSCQIQEIDNRFDRFGSIIFADLQNNVKKREFFPIKADSSEEIVKLFSKRDKKKHFHGSYTAQPHEMDTLSAELNVPSMGKHRFLEKNSVK